MKLKPGEADKALRSYSSNTFSIERTGEDGGKLYVQMTNTDIADYIRELETGMARLALAVVEKL